MDQLNLDQLKQYRTVIEDVLSEYCDWVQDSKQPGVKQYVSFDQERDHYFCFSIGWQGKKRDFSVVAYLRIEADKIWVEEDWTKQGMANALIDAGIPKSSIVLGFQHPSKRPLTKFSIGIEPEIHPEVSPAGSEPRPNTTPTALSDDRLRASHSP